MSLYLVEWEDQSITAVYAKDIIHVYEKLSKDKDYAGKLSSCTYKLYGGPDSTEDFSIDLRRGKPLYEEVPADPKLRKKTKWTEKQDLTNVHRIAKQNLIKNMENMFVKAKFGDVELEVEGKRIKCYRWILAQRSEYFRALFEGDMREKDMDVILIPGFRYSIVYEVVRFIYCGRYNGEVLKEDVDIDPKTLTTTDAGVPIAEAVTKIPNYLELARTADYFSLPDLVENIFLMVMFRLDSMHTTWSQLTKEGKDVFLQYATQVYDASEVLEKTSFKEDVSTLLGALGKTIEELDDDLKDAAANAHYRETKVPLYIGENADLSALLNNLGLSDTGLVAKLSETISQGAKAAEIEAAHILMRKCVPEEEFLTEIWEAIKYLIDNGYDINKLDEGNGQCLLHIAVTCKSLEYAKKLLELGADPTLQARNSSSAFWQAKLRMDSEISAKVFEGLIAGQEDVLALLEEQKEAFLKFEEVIELMIEKIGSRNHTDQPPQINLDINFIHSLADRMASFSERDFERDTIQDLIAPVIDYRLKDDNKDLQKLLARTLVPGFMDKMEAMILERQEKKKRGEEVQNIDRETIESMLKEDLTQFVERSKDHKLVSVKTLQKEGMLDGLPEDSWIFEALQVLETY